MTQFNESFYTDDFDQEMLDFVKENFEVTEDIDEWNLNHEGLIYGKNICFFWTYSISDYITYDFEYLTKQEFTLNNLEDGKELTLIWKRESPEKQKQREVIQTLEEDLKRAQNALEEAKSKLEDM